MNYLKCEKTNFDYIKVGGSNNKDIFILHGYGASMDDLAPLHSYLDPQKKFNWFFINGPKEVPIGPHMSGRAWFDIDMAQLQRAMLSGEFRDYSSQYPEELNFVLDKLENFIRLHGEDEIIVGGFSQGSMVTSHLMNKVKDKLIGYIALSGSLIGKDLLIERLEHMNSIPFFQSHGKMDQVLEYKQAMNLFELLKLMRLQGEFVGFEGGHEIPPIVIKKLKVFLDKLL
ncbi:MAG: hypothetical protein N4A33_04515 [Bacteriovoracaceae bacterium]|jgi:phospholipase/carboxylesterase|nr:hypothetical protein [Bacteriovoracaceae bacterium]